MAYDWMIDEVAHAGPEHLDPAFAAGYDRKQGHPDPAPDIARLAAHGLGRDATVVDLGAGTGQFALAAAAAFGRVIAAAGLEIVSAEVAGRVYAAYTCVRR